VMILVKMSRLLHSKTKDSWRDTAGYARCGFLCDEVGGDRKLYADEKDARVELAEANRPTGESGILNAVAADQLADYLDKHSV